MSNGRYYAPYQPADPEPDAAQIRVWMNQGRDMSLSWFENGWSQSEMAAHIANNPELEPSSKAHVRNGAAEGFNRAMYWRSQGNARGLHFTTGQSLRTYDAAWTNMSTEFRALQRVPREYRNIYRTAGQNAFEGYFETLRWQNQGRTVGNDWAAASDQRYQIERRQALETHVRAHNAGANQTAYIRAALDAFDAYFRRLAWISEGRNRGSNWTGDRATLEQSLTGMREQARGFYNDYVQTARDAYNRREWRNEGQSLGSTWSRDSAALEVHLAGRRAETGRYHGVFVEAARDAFRARARVRIPQTNFLKKLTRHP